jgi:hypothetical protein
MSTAKRKLLLIACSNRKIRTRGLLSALERYDGVTYRVIRKAQREGYFPQDVDIKILSAKFGLIDAKTRIPYYDQRMDAERARVLQPQVLRSLKRVTSRGQYSQVFINMGKIYFVAIDGFMELLDSRARVGYAAGGIGEKAKAMKEWFYVAK